MNNIIAWWSGAIVDIPTGWSICDGNGGRPDLRDQFLICAGDTYAPDDSGGAENHNHDFTGDGHAHFLPSGENLTFGPDFHSTTTTVPATGTTDNENNLPPYHALALIMKD